MSSALLVEDIARQLDHLYAHEQRRRCEIDRHLSFLRDMILEYNNRLDWTGEDQEQMCQGGARSSLEAPSEPVSDAPECQAPKRVTRLQASQQGLGATVKMFARTASYRLAWHVVQEVSQVKMGFNIREKLFGRS